MSDVIFKFNLNEQNASNGDNRKDSESSDTECDQDLQFKPIISLPEVEVSTNEENESELLKIRAKLYRFDSSVEPAEWKERGTGELKLLRHNEKHCVRIVMRRDKTFKVCANHFITPWMELKASSSSDKAFIYTVMADFADETPKSECFAIRFGSVENANLFKEKFEEAKKIVATECELYNEAGNKNEDEQDEEDEESNSDNSSSTANSSEFEKISLNADNEETEDMAKKMAELDVKKEEKD